MLGRRMEKPKVSGKMVLWHALTEDSRAMVVGRQKQQEGLSLDSWCLFRPSMSLRVHVIKTWFLACAPTIMWEDGASPITLILWQLIIFAYFIECDIHKAMQMCTCVCFCMCILVCVYLYVYIHSISSVLFENHVYYNCHEVQVPHKRIKATT